MSRRLRHGRSGCGLRGCSNALADDPPCNSQSNSQSAPYRFWSHIRYDGISAGRRVASQVFLPVRL
jgi:hypothetical protein